MSQVKAYYDSQPEREWQRLDTFRTEYAVTLRALETYLPKPPATVFDNGGGPGRYAIALAQRGYTVTLADLSDGNLALANKKAREAQVNLAGVHSLNALDLSTLADAQFDAVLMMGPLYHLLDIAERQQAIAEAKRVLKTGGLIFAAFITRFATFRDAAANFPAWIANDWAYTKRMLKTGLHDSSKGFTDSYFAHPNEVVPLMESAEFETLNVIGCEGVAAGSDASLNELDEQTWEKWVTLNYEMGQDPTLWGASDHLLYVGKKV